MSLKFSSVLSAMSSIFISAIIALALIACYMTSSSITFVSASVMGIDIGTESIKIAAPKNNNMEIVLNEQSHRKSVNAVGFRGDERYFADEAKNLAARFPDNMFLGVNRLVGVNINNTKLHKDWYRGTLHYTPTIEEFHGYLDTVTGEDGTTTAVTANERGFAGVSGTLQLRTGSNPDVAYSAEALTAMLFTYIKTTVEKDTRLKIADAVVTVPAHYDRKQRQATIDAAELAGVRVIALTHPTTAAAIQFGMNRRGFGNETVHVLVLDVGAAHVDAGVYTFTPPPSSSASSSSSSSATSSKKSSSKKNDAPSKVRNAEALGTITTRAIVSTNEVGGRIFDSCLAKYIEDKFVAANPKANERVLGAETLPKRKAVVSLMRAANKAKEMLSANRVAPIIVEGIAPDRDFGITITREEFEHACAPLFAAIPKIVNAALERAEMKMEDLVAFELFGAGGRIPRVIEDLSKMRADGKPVDRTLNTDEAAALGAGFYAGALAGRFRIKCFAVADTISAVSQLGSPTRFAEQNITFALTPKQPTADPSKPPVQRTLYHAGSKYGARKSVTVQRDEDFGVYVSHSYVDSQNAEKVNHETTREIDRFVNVSGIEKALDSCFYYFAPDAKTADAAEQEENEESEQQHQQQSQKLVAGRALRHPSNTHQIRVDFRLSESGLIEVEGAELRATFMQNVSKKIRVNLTDEEIDDAKERAKARVIAAEEVRLAKKADEEAARKANATSGNGNETAAADEGDESEANEQSENATVASDEPDESSTTNNNKTSASNSSKKSARKEENATAVLERKISIALKAVRTYRVETKWVEEARKKSVPLTITQSFPSPTPHLSNDKTLAKRILRALDDVDRVKRETAAAKNDLEAYIVWCKNEGILDNKQLRDLKLLDKEEDEQKIVDALKNATEWLEEEGSGDEVPTQSYVDRLKELHVATGPVIDKFNELTQPKKASTTKKSSTKKASTKKKPSTKSSSSNKNSKEDDDDDSQEQQQEGSAAAGGEAEQGGEEEQTGEGESASSQNEQEAGPEDGEGEPRREDPNTNKDE